MKQNRKSNAQHREHTDPRADALSLRAAHSNDDLSRIRHGGYLRSISSFKFSVMFFGILLIGLSEYTYAGSCHAVCEPLWACPNFPGCQVFGEEEVWCENGNCFWNEYAMCAGTVNGRPSFVFIECGGYLPALRSEDSCSFLDLKTGSSSSAGDSSAVLSECLDVGIQPHPDYASRRKSEWLLFQSHPDFLIIATSPAVAVDVSRSTRDKQAAAMSQVIEEIDSHFSQIGGKSTRQPARTLIAYPPAGARHAFLDLQPILAKNLDKEISGYALVRLEVTSAGHLVYIELLHASDDQLGEVALSHVYRHAPFDLESATPGHVGALFMMVVEGGRISEILQQAHTLASETEP